MASFFFVDDNTASKNTYSTPRPTLVQVARSLPSSSSFPEGDSAFASPSSLRRAQVCPPSLFSRSGPQWKQWVVGFWSWLWDLEEYQDPMPVLTGLTKVKSEFCAAMWDLQSVRANQVRDAIEHARSLRELWHLRADVFRAISTHRGQTEATVRIEALNEHFPVRMSRPTTEIKLGRTTSW